MLAHRNKQDFAVLMVDADYFKNINENKGSKTLLKTYGHYKMILNFNNLIKKVMNR